MGKVETKVSYYVELASGVPAVGESDLTESEDVYINPVPGAGLGLYAKRAFRPGDLVLAEAPFLVIPCKAVTEAEARDAVRSAVERLSPELQAIFYSFSDKNTFDDASVQPTIKGIADTNGLPMGDQVGGSIPTHAGMYALMCRLNHSCRPNVHHQWSPMLKKQTIHCIRPVRPGEELLTAYFNCSGMQREQRQLKQKRKWNFNCTCERCLLTGEALAASDARAREIHRLDDGIGMMGGLNPRLALQYVEERILLMKQEAAYDLTELVRTEFDAFQICMNDPKGNLFLEARRWIRSAFLHSVQSRGLAAEQTQKLRGFCLAPHRIRDDLDEDIFHQLGSPEFVDKVEKKYSFQVSEGLKAY